MASIKVGHKSVLITIPAYTCIYASYRPVDIYFSFFSHAVQPRSRLRIKVLNKSYCPICSLAYASHYDNKSDTECSIIRPTNAFTWDHIQYLEVSYQYPA